MGEVKATQIKNYDKFINPGDYRFTGKVNLSGIFGMIFVCPCGCGEQGHVSFDNAPKQDHPRWHWNENEHRPTLTPSLNKTDGCGWHGYLTDGIFQSV